MPSLKKNTFFVRGSAIFETLEKLLAEKNKKKIKKETRKFRHVILGLFH